MRAVLAGLAMALLATGTAAAADLIVEKSVQANGNTELAIVNRNSAPVSIYKLVINDRTEQMCTLLPVKSDYGSSFRRGDLFTNPDLVRFDDQKPLTEIVLPLGGEVSAGSYRDCGRVLLVFIYTSDGDEVWQFEN
jgi:hypothetical protein